MKKISPKNILSFISLALLFPMIASAQEKLSARDFMEGIGDLDKFINALTTGAVKSTGVLLMAVAMVVFLLGIVQYIWGLRQGKADATTTGKTFMSWGLVALFVMFSVYGIVKLAQSVFFNGKDINTITIPELNFGPRNGTTANPNSTKSSDPYTPKNPTNPTTNPTNPNPGTSPGAAYMCPDGVTPYNDPSDKKLCPKPTYCPDGVNYYYNPSDAKLCSKTTPTSSGGSTPGDDPGFNN